MLSGIRLQGWMGVRDVDLAIGKPFVLFMGENGAGKTNVAKAIGWAITGRYRCDQIGASIAKKDLPDVVIQDDAKACRVGLMLGPALYVERALTRGGAETLKVVTFDEDGQKQTLEGTTAELQAELYRLLQLDPVRAEAALDSWAFLAMKNEDRIALLFRALGSASAAEVQKRIEARGLRGPDVHRLSELAASKGFRAAEKAAVELRREKHRALSDLPEPQQAPQVVVVNGQERDLETVNLEALETLLADNRHERDQVLRNAGSDLGAARARVEALETQRAMIQTRTISEPTDDAAKDTLRMARTQAIERAKAAGAAEQEASDRIDALTRDIARTNALVNVAEIDHPGRCPVVPGGFLCPATKSGLQVHARKLRKQTEAAAAELQRAEEERASVLATREAKHREREAAEAEERKLAGEYRAVEEEQLAAARAQGQLEQVERDLEAARVVLAKAEQAGEEKPTEFLDRRIVSIETVMRAKRAWEDAKADTSAQRRETLVREHEDADALAQALAASGVESELLQEALIPIRSRLDTTGKMLGEVTIDDDLTVRTVVNGHPRLYEQLSRSQRLRLGIAMQDAIAQASGLPLLLVDELDVFVGPDRAAVLRVLRGLVGDPYGSVIGFAAATEPARPALPEMAVYHVRSGGEIRAVEGREAA